jgi:3'(2'), 5'-bisphosphate nucleotidase
LPIDGLRRREHRVTDPAALLAAIEQAALQAGEVILEIYETDFDVDRKADNSPVTEADVKAEAVILDALLALTPDIPIVAEEEAAAGKTPTIGDAFWLVDPLDGTREFLNRNGEFTVNIALVRNGNPVLGVVHAPARDVTYTGIVGDGAAIRDGGGPPEAIAVRTPPETGLTIASSRRHGSDADLERFLGDYTVTDRIICGSSLKFCLVAAGDADLYPRFGPTMEWDTAAGHAVLAAAGGRLTTTDGDAFVYGKPDFRNPGFIAWGALR